ncbi:MAG: RidA family protein [Bacteroidia bacterium]|jgi:2-aminomuconate deaminase
MSTISTQNAPNPVGLYPHARRVGNLLFLSGIGPRAAGTDAHDPQVPGLKLDKNGNFESFDFEAQVHQVLANVKAVLEASGARMEDLVDITVFLTDMQRDFKTFNKVYATYFRDMDPKPCRTTVEVGALPTAIAVELKCIAVIPDAR